MRRAKIKIQEAETATGEDEEQEREIEYMPPREVPLPDYPDDWPHDRTYPQFEGKNLTRGWWSEFGPQKDEDEDEDDEFSDFEQKLKRIEELNEKKKQQTQQAKKATAVKKPPVAKTSRDPLTAKMPQTLKAKEAASALSKSTKPSTTSSFAAPTATAKARLPFVLAAKKPVGSTTTLGNSRHTAARAASNSTVGYSKGRAVSAGARLPVAGPHDRQLSSDENEKPLPTKTTDGGVTSLDELFGLQDLSLGDNVNVELHGSIGKDLAGMAEVEDELEEFQLDPVEL